MNLLSDTEIALEENIVHPIPHAAIDSWDGQQLLAAFTAAADWLDQHADTLNDINVFPAPDGDTGTNMALTLGGALGEVEPHASCAVVAERVKYWATMRGRGNSGIILSQVLRGFAQGLSGHERMGAAAFTRALGQASAMAYQSVIQPVEGTMLTVIREAAAAAQTALAHATTLAGVLEAAVRGAREAVSRTPALLKALRDAGVVDAGGQGVFLILEGMLRYARGESLHRAPAASHASKLHVFHDRYGQEHLGYCTNFVLLGVNMPYQEIRAALATLGLSAVIVGDGDLIKVHIHTSQPGDALNYAVGFGVLTQIEITNMDLQHSQRHAAQNAPPAAIPADPAETIARIGIVAVAPGAGFAAIFRSLNAGAVISGGQAAHPHAQELLEAIERLPQQEVIVLPNHANTLMAAQQAARLSAKRVAIIPTRTAPQGSAALIAFNYQAGLEQNARAMTAAIQQMCTAEMTTAIRDAVIAGVAVRAGQTIGLLDGDLVVAAEDRDLALDELLGRMRLDDRDVLTIYYGGAVGVTDAEAIAERIQGRFARLEVEVQEGGQPVYDYVIAAE